MEYLQPTGGQIMLFLRSAGFGFLLGVLYDALRLFRLAADRKGMRFVWDVLFGVLAAVGTFLYTLVCCDGQMRLFVFAAMGAGFAAWYAFVSPAVRRYTDRCLRAAHSLRAEIGATSARLERRWSDRARKLSEKFIKSLKKFQKSQKST